MPKQDPDSIVRNAFSPLCSVYIEIQKKQVEKNSNIDLGIHLMSYNKEELRFLILKLFESGKFVNLDSKLTIISEAIRDKWVSAIKNVPKKAQWFSRMALLDASGGGGGLIINRIPGGMGFRISYANKGDYNYFRVIEYGRPRFDMKPGLLASPRARMGKNGRYIIIMFSKNEDGSKVNPTNNSINSVMTKLGSVKVPNADGKKVTRNRYSYRQDPGMTGKGNTFVVSEQKQKGGNIHRSYGKFVVLSEKSKGWYYPEIPAANTKKIIKREMGETLSHPKVKQSIRKAVATDLKPELVKWIKNTLEGNK